MRYYARYAELGVGLVMTEATFTDEAASRAYFNQPGMANARHQEGWKGVVEAVHAAGRPIVLHLVDEFLSQPGRDLSRRLAVPLAIARAVREAFVDGLLSYNFSLYKMDDLSYQPPGGRAARRSVRRARAAGESRLDPSRGGGLAYGRLHARHGEAGALGVGVWSIPGAGRSPRAWI